ncbi:MAG: peptidoglycan DD-metalloendopeptidase family protein [Anaerolineales bacterium]|nr:peptidoglycan DD-metalloendopeptidase family protein [Anaerolineales bacterium]
MKRIGLIFALLLAFSLVITSQAQEGTSDGPVYIVQPGDTLFSIALRFGVTMDELVTVNQIANPNNLEIGASLVVPGLEGISGVLTTEVVPFGETLRSLSRRYHIPLDDLARLNRIVSPAELFLGSQVVLPVDLEGELLQGRRMVRPGQSLLETAVLEGANPWSMTDRNDFETSSLALPGDVLVTPSGTNPGPGALPESITGVDFADLPFIQGETTTIEAFGEMDLTLSGSFEAADLRNGNMILAQTPFFQLADGRYVGLQGVHAMTEPGFYPYRMMIRQGEGSETVYSQNIYVGDGDYVYDPSLQVDPKTLDPAATGPENEIWNELGSRAAPDKSWDGLFASPALFPDCYTSRFGSRRSYNDGPYNFFHTGLDFCGGVGLEVKAPAPGKVTFAGPLVVRGNSIMLEHGWGINTGYMHLSEILVKEGDLVETGQVIGLVGGTGRVTGAHLHWEVWASGFQVNPVTWLETVFPQESSSDSS